MSVTSARKPTTILASWLTPRREGSVSKGPTSLFPHGIQDPEEHNRRAEDADLDWQRAAPRWFLLLLVAILLVASGWMFSEIRGGTSREQARLEAAIADAPSKYQARLSERVAVVEAQAATLNSSISALTVQLDRQAQATTDLTVQLRVLNAEIKARK